MRRPRTLMLAWLALATLTPAEAQPLGTFRWQLQPYCNVITVTVAQVGGIYRLEGYDDRCGATEASSVIGTALVNADGSIGIGLNIVTAPGGQAHPLSARLALSTLGGTWSSGPDGGAFVFTPGPGSGGTPRAVPGPASPFPGTFRLQNDGGFVAGGTFATGDLPASGAGVRLMWAPARAAIRAGRVEGTQWDEPNIGVESAALGHNTRATGARSFAANDGTEASGTASTALGYGTRATGTSSLALGEQTLASGGASIAAGQSSTASGIGSFAAGWFATALGNFAVALGNSTTAGGASSVALGLRSAAPGERAFTSGDFNVAGGVNSVAIGAAATSPGDGSIAMGLRVRASGAGSVVLGSDAVANPLASGSFVFGDRSTSVDIVSFAPNEFIARAAGGVGFYTNAAATSGVELAPGSSSWASLSDASMKENVREVSGDEILRALAGLPIREWNYKAQDPAIRHMGPTAQDFDAAFGLGESALLINSVDADGVALAAARALQQRRRALHENDDTLERENAALRAMTESLSRENQALRERLDRLERLLGR